MTETLKPDFHAKLYWAKRNSIWDFQPNAVESWESIFKGKDVLAEREHYQKQIGYLNRQMKLHIETGDRMIKRAEAAEKKAKDFEDAAGAMSAELTEFGERAEKAEARVQKLKTEILKEAKYADGLYDDLQRAGYPVARSLVKRLEALAGEKTK